MNTKQPKNLVVVMGTKEDELHDVYTFLSKEGFTAWFNKMHRGLSYNVSVDPKEFDKAMDAAINYSIANGYDDIICLLGPCQKIKDIIESRENTL